MKEKTPQTVNSESFLLIIRLHINSLEKNIAKLQVFL